MFENRGLAAFIVAMAVGLSSPAATQTVRDGINSWQKGAFSAAVETWKPLAAAGNADAAFNLGQAYRLGKGVPIDLARAQQLFEQAARKGHVDAATNLGIMLFQSNNRTASMRWLRQAAEGDEPRAMLLYGTALFNGDGVKADPIRAYALVSRAAAQGLEPAKATLADLDEVMPLEQRQAGVKMAQALLSTHAKGGDATEREMKSSASPPKPTERTAKVEAKPVPAKTPVSTAKPAPMAPPTTSSGGWRIQLGAFSSKTAAQGLFGKLSGRLGGAQAYYVPVGAMTRLQVGPFGSKAAADATCARLKPQPCFAVAAK